MTAIACIALPPTRRSGDWLAPRGPSESFVVLRAVLASARRGRRCPVGAHAVAVCASRRLRCGARPSVASQNSLRSLRSLRSDNCDESDHEARCARRLKACAPRRHRSRPHRAAPAALQRLGFVPQAAPAPQQGRVRAGRGAPLERREAQGSWPRAQRGSWTDSSQLSERSERSERSEFCDGATRPSIAGKPERSVGRSGEALRPARTRLCRAQGQTRNRPPRTTATGRVRTAAQRPERAHGKPFVSGRQR